MNTGKIYKGEYGVFLYKKQELARLKKLEAQALSEARTCRRNPVSDCQTLAQKLLQIKPELREWLEVNFKEYL